jgi:hypothetical protein
MYIRLSLRAARGECRRCNCGALRGVAADGTSCGKERRIPKREKVGNKKVREAAAYIPR